LADPIETAKSIAKILRENEQVDLVVALSHGGVRRRPGDSEFHGEDIELARKVPEIDVVVSGHSHTLLREPIFVNGTPIVQAGEHGRYAGVLELEIAGGEVSVQDYKIIDIDDEIPGDVQIQAEVERLKSVVSDSFLARYGYSFSKPLVETDFDLMIEQRESNLGNLVADAIRWGIDRAEEKSENAKNRLDIAIEANGQIRNHLLKGQSGIQQVSDLFRPVGLGIGVVDETPGYPLVKFYVTALEIKKALEVLTTVHPRKGPSYFMQVSGLRFRYNPNRLMFDRVIEVEIESENGEFVALNTSASNERLYSVGTNFYVASFIKLIGSFTYGILDIVPKNEFGKPIETMREALVDADSNRDGVQELKEWLVFLDYVRSFEDVDGNGLADIPEKYRSPEGRIVEVKSWHPVLLFKNATYLTWSVTAFALVVFAGVCLTALVVVRKLKR
jgi:5'-nucleotidase